MNCTIDIICGLSIRDDVRMALHLAIRHLDPQTSPAVHWAEAETSAALGPFNLKVEDNVQLAEKVHR